MARFYNTEIIEKLGKLGYWEWCPKEEEVYFSSGINHLLDIEYPLNSLNSILTYLKTNCYKNGHQLLLNYFNRIKLGYTPKPIVIGVYNKNNKLKYVEITASITKKNEECGVWFSGIVQDVTESKKYTILKEKETLFESKIADLAARFINLENFNDSLTYTLEEIGKLTRSSKVILYKVDNNKVGTFLNWHSPSVSPNTSFIKSIPTKELKLLLDLVKVKQTIHFQGIDSLPSFAKKTKVLGIERKVESILISTIQKDKQTVGALLLLKYHKNDNWDFADIHMVKMTSLIISNTLKQHIVKEKLHESEQRLQLALKAGRLGAWELNLKTKQLNLDEKYAQLLGYAPKTINKLDNWFTNNIHPDYLPQYENALDTCLAGEKSFYELEYQIKCNNNTYLWVNDWGIATKTDKDGFPIEMVGITQDISKRKAAELSLIKAKDKAEENDKLKTAFLSNMSHEIRTPMNGINGFAELLYNQREPEDNQRNRYLEIIYQSSNKLLKLVNNIVDIAKLETKQISIYHKEFQITNMLNEVENIFRHLQIGNNGHNPQIKFKRNSQIENAFSDETRIIQILSILVENAIKFSSDGMVNVGYSINNQDQLQFYVEDSGPGIKTKKDIFEHFLQSELVQDKNLGGTGLGLAIAKGLVHLLGGKIWFKTIADKGTTFYFTVDYKPVAVEN